jgi:hypothetical protein
MMDAVSPRYRAEVLEALAGHGLRPTPATPPARVRDLLNDLYCYELRRLRGRLLRREFPKPTYAARVVDLRRRYPLLSVPLAAWTETPEDP